MMKTEAQKAATERWRKANPEHVRVSKAAWHKQNREKNPEKVRNAENAWYADNRTEVCRRAKEARLKNLALAREKALVSKWKKAGIDLESIPPRPANCQLCGGTSKSGRALALDHDHKTNMFRAWLCSGCNTMLGHAKDSPELLRKAADLLEKNRGS